MNAKKFMKVIKAFGPQDLRVVEAPVPEPGPGYVRVKVRASGICGSDKPIWHVKSASDYVVGHEVAGEVDALGGGVTSLAAGDRVMINNVVGCGVCPACRAGEFVFCPHRDGQNDVGNGYGEYVVAPARNCARILPGLSFVDGALIMDNWGTPYGGILRGRIRQGMDVLVSGCGPIGRAAIALLKAFGAYVIAADPVEWRRSAALQGGADRAVPPEALPGAARDATDGLGVHAVMECSGNGNAYENCMKSLRCGGTMVAIGEGAEFMLRPSAQMIHRFLTITGTWYSTLPHVGEVMQLALQGRINLQSFLTHTITLDEVPALFGPIVNCEDGIAKCVIVFD
jgi:threonine dehydrogenase-like Zn-dependent dehydrogenase